MGELLEAVTDDGRNLGLVRAKPLDCFRLGESLVLDGCGNPGRQLGLREGLLRLGHSDVSKDVFATLGDGA